jgi:hypothetical protein
MREREYGGEEEERRGEKKKITYFFLIEYEVCFLLAKVECVVEVVKEEVFAVVVEWWAWKNW